MVDTNYISWNTAQGVVGNPTMDMDILQANRHMGGPGGLGLSSLFGPESLLRRGKGQKPGMAGPKVNKPTGELPPAKTNAPKQLPSGKENPMLGGKKPPALPPNSKPQWNDPTGAIEVKAEKVPDKGKITHSPTAARAGKQAEMLLDHTDATRPMTGKATGTGRIGAAGKELMAKVGDWCKKCPGIEVLSKQASRLPINAKAVGKVAGPLAAGVTLYEAGQSFEKAKTDLNAEQPELRHEHALVKLSQGAAQGIKQYQNMVAEKVQPGVDQFVMGENTWEKTKGLGKAAMGMGESILSGVPTIIGGAAGGIHAAFTGTPNNQGRLEARSRGPRLPMSGRVDDSPQLLADTDAVNLDASRSVATMTPSLTMNRTRQGHHR